MYRKINSDMKFMERELEIQKLWEKLALQNKLENMNPDGRAYTVFDGPPTANGKPHIGHVLTRSIKDLVPRYRRMKGYKVEFKAGWDTHGLPVEIEVEKNLGLNGKEDIVSYGVEDFIKQCKESVWKYQDEWEEMSARLAYSANLKDPYITYENNYIESEWWALKQIWEKDLLYKGFRVVPYCARCGTALSSHEVAQGYKDVKDTSAFVRFKVKNEDAWFSAWTTTPWTLPSNVALTINANYDYVLIELKELEEDFTELDKTFDETESKKETSNKKQNNNLPSDDPAFAVGTKYYIAEALADKVFGEDRYNIIKKFKGSELLGMEYEPILPYANEIVAAQSDKRAFVICSADYVTLSDGTGIVHTAPAFGEDDSKVGRKYNLAFVQLVDSEGHMTEDVTDFAGQWVKDADKGILAKLKEENSLLRSEKYEHNYPHCWRCDTPLIYYARDEWFVEMTKLRDRLMDNNQEVIWMPETVKDGRFGNFLDNVVDWNISRERFWGTPLPLWECRSCDYTHCIGSIEELQSMSDNCPDDIELHKPYIDNVEVNCPKCNAKMKRTPEVIDVWFDSGSMPFAQYHYPFENKEKFEENFPANFISEAEDQTRGWFYSLMAVNTLLFDKAPYESVLVMGLVQDENGRKMSKHLGNVVDPWSIINKQGTDAVRWYFYRNSNPWLPSRFSDDTVTEGMRKFMATLWNTLSFYTMYADIDEFDPCKYELEFDKLSIMDKWLLATLNDLVKTVDSKLEAEFLDITGAARAIEIFADYLSNWYVRRCRERFWVGEMEQDKVNAYMTLYTTLEYIARLLAPFLPFISEAIYQTVVKTTNADAAESVHLCEYPLAQVEWENKALVNSMAELMEVVQLGRAARNNSAMKNRQPLSEVLIAGVSKFNEDLTKVLLEELNIDKVKYIDNLESLTTYSFKPNFRTLGKKLGAKVPQAKKVIEALDGDKAWNELKSNGELKIDLDGEEFVLSQEDLVVETGNAEGYQIENGSNVDLALNLRLDDELIKRGYIREIVSKVQNLRKDSGFEVVDRIILYYAGSENIQAAIEEYAEVLMDDVLAVEIRNEHIDNSFEFDINDEVTFLAVEKK